MSAPSPPTAPLRGATAPLSGATAPSPPTAPLSGAVRVEWCDTSHHSTDNAPLNGVVAVRGNATTDEIAALVTALARRLSRVHDRYERWRRNRIAAVARRPSAPPTR
jgi:hypothetical protein